MENATDIKGLTPELAMPEKDPLRAEIAAAADRYRAVKQVRQQNVKLTRNRP